MLEKIEEIITVHFIIVIAVGFVIGFSFQDLSGFLNPYIIPILMIVMYFSFLRIDAEIFMEEVKKYVVNLYLCFLTVIIVPVVIFYLCLIVLKLFSLHESWAIGPLILFLSPTSALSVTFTIILKGKFERALLNLVLTSFIAPFSMPFLLRFLAGSYVEIDFYRMMGLLSLIIAIPFVLSRINGIFFPAVKRALLPHLSSASIILLTLVEIGALEGFRSFALEKPSGFFGSIALSIFVLMSAYALGWVLAGSKNPVDRITVTLLTTWPNLGLPIGIANTFFREDMPNVFFFLVVMVLPWHISIAFPKWISRRHSLR
uniref:Predicted Na+-dependent transporter n=1 Tax=Candidatus Kentrum sp. FM TaxID=2126340 RepID=A0A450W0P0_9GAMM|nr:MAG: Predicted Na+-dependent transporter [Candidatus Kentron sp. FM]VFJ56131.1 MAG: Predicted Na+-dependent transporter [Candidatus Kentron sp. FM]VFK10611.1 MAG: Predicted Na+-dependent transporter [Candidatus Kentron sp. FM]